jgi:GTP cyclohydrolase III
MKHAADLPLATRKTLISAACFLCVLFGTFSPAQQTIPQAAPPATPGDAAWEAKQQRQLAKQENAKREQDLKKDTEKLLELATELKHYVDKTNEHTLSVDVIKKADEIEKLAHTVKEKMKGQ